MNPELSRRLRRVKERRSGDRVVRLRCDGLKTTPVTDSSGSESQWRICFLYEKRRPEQIRRRSNRQKQIRFGFGSGGGDVIRRGGAVVMKSLRSVGAKSAPVRFWRDCKKVDDANPAPGRSGAWLRRGG